MSGKTVKRWPKQLRKRDVLLIDDRAYEVVKVESVLGGSWFNVYFKGHESEAVAFGHGERVDVIA